MKDGLSSEQMSQKPLGHFLLFVCLPEGFLMKSVRHLTVQDLRFSLLVRVSVKSSV